jgi:hypothetical protein
MMECRNSGIMALGMMQCWVDGKILVDEKKINEY